MLTEKKLKALGFERFEWSEDGIVICDHKLKKGGVTIEITNLTTVEITTQGQYVPLPLDSEEKLEQLINLLS
ncbi:hypothetical protein [Sphingobacterium psychroaquaticum]|uniref:Uncharacterized protein n=1 Tax=Sphingobacterium psychroaquaticum TaxID=561061 RepID=A0A1X7JV90_9SPHI|nr:hypothetical protein [Sphingobacterium psychroaquaticum]SMG31728.1 hypothetical protein SAMN05660862_2215 [Sphingobacterium psychroaquaticum]